MAKKYRPNRIPAHIRWPNLIFAVCLLTLCGLGLYQDEVRGAPFPKQMKYHGTPAWIMAGAYVSAALHLLSVFLDHYDRRNNERDYRRFQIVTTISGVALSLLAMVLHLMGVD